MATFGSLQEESDAAARAITCAFELLAEIERWNAKRGARQVERLSIVIGVHFGPVVVGNLGSENRLEFTVVGDVVNVASRLEEATRELGCARWSCPMHAFVQPSPRAVHTRLERPLS
jgi:adenylate cyclase